MKKLILLSSLSLSLFSCGDNNGISSSNVKSENNIKNNDLQKKECVTMVRRTKIPK